jgi:hypothetical protein
LSTLPSLQGKCSVNRVSTALPYEGGMVHARRSLAGLIALLALSFAAPAPAATITAAASAKVVKPLVLNRLQDFDLGTVMLGSGTFSGATLRLSRANVRTCPAQITCSGATQVAIYNVSGTNNTTVRISTPDVVLVNQSDASKTLRLTVDGPTSVVLTSSGPPGVNFQLGGSIPLNSNTAPGLYQGTFNVTVDY